MVSNKLTILAVAVLGGAYLIYGRYLAKKWGINPDSQDARL